MHSLEIKQVMGGQSDLIHYVCTQSVPLKTQKQEVKTISWYRIVANHRCSCMVVLHNLQE